MKATVLAMVLGFGLLTSVGARTWTNAGGDKTFEGELVSYDVESKVVEVRMRNGKTMKFAEDKLSEGDIKFLKDWVEENREPDAEELLAEQEVGQMLLKAKLSKLEGRKFEEAKMESAPEYYLIYFSASW